MILLEFYRRRNENLIDADFHERGDGYVNC